MASPSMSRSMPRNGVQTGSKQGSRPVSPQVDMIDQLNDMAAQTATNRERKRALTQREASLAIAPFFDRAIDKWVIVKQSKREAYGEEIGADKATLSLLCNTDPQAHRLINLGHLLPALQTEESALELVRGFAAIGGLSVLVDRRFAISFDELKTRIFEWVWGDERTRDHAVQDIAEDTGREVDELIEVGNRGDRAPDEAPPMLQQGVTP